MNKIKEFFDQRAVIIVEGVLIALASAGLFIGGFNAEEVAKSITFNIGGSLTALEGAITIIQGLTKKPSTENK